MVVSLEYIYYYDRPTVSIRDSSFKTSLDCMNQIDEDVYIHMSYILY